MLSREHNILEMNKNFKSVAHYQWIHSHLDIMLLNVKIYPLILDQAGGPNSSGLKFENR